MKGFIKASLLAAMVAAPVMADEAFGGIGVTIYQLRDGVKVAEVIPGTPAAESKLQAGDVIIAVDGQSLARQSIEDSKDMLRGQVNKPLEITFVSGADTLTSVIRRAQLTVKDLNGDEVEAWYGDKALFKAAELETYATATESDKQLVAVLQRGTLLQKDADLSAKDLNGVYVDRAEEFAPKAPAQALVKASSATIKGISRKAVGVDLKAAGTAVVTIMSAEGEQVAVIRLDNAQPGFNAVSWNGEKVPAGRYMVTVEHNGSISGKNAIIK